jgi:ABC-2 type transport system permease protein
MNRIWIVARWEFLCTVMRASFLITVVSLPLVHVGIALLLGHALNSVKRPAETSRPIAIVDARGILHDGAAGEEILTRDEAAAMETLNAGRVEAVFVLADDYLQSGRLRVYTPPARGLFTFADGLERRNRVDTVIRRGLLTSRVDPDVLSRAVVPVADVTSFTFDRSGRAKPDSGSQLAILAGTSGLCFLLSLSIFMSSGLLQQAMAVERQNRVLEVVMASVKPLPLLAGKVLGLSAAGLIQVGVYFAFAIGAAPLALGMVDIPLSTLAWSLACFLTGYVLYACVMAATGALGRGTQESAQIATVWVIVGAVPLFLIGSISADGSSMLARVLSWIPLTSPVTLLLRLGVDAVSPLELSGALLLTLAAAAGALVVSSTLLRRVTIAGAR